MTDHVAGGYKRGCRCEPCVEKHRAERRAYMKRRREASRVAPIIAGDDPRHGTTNAYANFGCRCGACRQAHRAEGTKPRRNLKVLRRELALEPSLETQFGDLARE